MKTMVATTPATKLAAVVGALLCAVYLRWTPLVPDLAAQVARADMIRTGGLTSWWTGWFGGLSLPDYSVLVPQSMAMFGVRTTGVISAMAATVATSLLVRDTLRPRAGALAFAVMITANLLDGRVTFTVGFAAAAWALVALRARRNGAAVLLAVGAYFASPLAGLFLGMVLVAVILTQPDCRRAAATSASVLLVTGAVMVVFFPGTGTMPFGLWNAVPGLLCCVGVVLACPARTVRSAAAVVALSVPLFLVVPSAVGTNVGRLAWVCAVPVAVACGRLPRPLLAAAAALLVSWPVADLTGQLASAQAESSQPSFYRPLTAELAKAAAAAGPAAKGERVEVVDTANHWASVYLSASSLARGWDRQADHANNPIFYDDAQLDAASYSAWLHELAVGWVALPAAKLDYASIAEGRLVDAGLPYLALRWSNPQWRLYRVIGATPLATGAQVLDVSGGGVTLATTAARTVHTRMRWSPYLIAIDPSTGLPIRACLINAAQWVDIYVPNAQTFELTARFAPTQRLGPPEPDCVSDLQAGEVP